MRKGNSWEIRRLNRRALLMLLRHEPLSRSELAQRTGLAKSAVSRLVEELLAEGLLEEGEAQPGPLGRPKTPLSLRPGARYALGAEVGVKGTVLVAVEWKGQVLWQKAWAHAQEDSLEARLERLRHEAAPWASKALGLGVTLPGVVRGRTLLVAPNLGWRLLDLSLLERHLGLPVAFENDAKASALSEIFFHGSQSLAYVVLSVGLGVGVVAEGRLLRGALGAAGELGHWTEGPGKPCRCGRRGCLETRLSLEGLLEHYRALGGKAENLDELLEAAKRGEEPAQEALAHLGEALGGFLANVAVAYDPERIVIGGQAAKFFPFLEASLRARLSQEAFLEDHKQLPVYPSVYGHLAPAVGGASLFIAQFFELGGLWALSPRREGGGYAEVVDGTSSGLRV